MCAHSYISQLAAPTTFNAFLILVIGLPIKAINYKLHIGYGCAYYTLRHKTMSKLGSAPKFTNGKAFCAEFKNNLFSRDRFNF